MLTRSELSPLFGGIPPSRRASYPVLRAIAIGIDPTKYTVQAGRAALEKNKKKAGRNVPETRENTDYIAAAVYAKESPEPSYETRSVQAAQKFLSELIREQLNATTTTVYEREPDNRTTIDWSGNAIVEPTPDKSFTIYCPLQQGS